MGKSKRKKTNYYKMKGCARTKKTYLGGSADVNLAYPSSNIPTTPNQNLAYTGSTNTNRAYPSSAPHAGGFNFLVPQTGGTTTAVILGGSKHRENCSCRSCKTKQMGGGCGSCSMSPPTPMLGGSHGLPYPNGLLGSAWTPDVQTWPGVSGVAMNNNHLAYNNYAPVDVSRQMLDVGAQKPYTYLGGRRRHKKTRKPRKSFKRRGGGLTNFMGQDLVNFGRQVQFGVGSTYNALSGYQSPVSPLPWKDQLVNKPVSLMYTS
jgi:hypothetical protein